MSTVVFCEDDPSVRRLILATMRSSTHAIHVAEDGVEGLTLVKACHPDLVVTDIAMPRMNGLELALALRANRGTERLPIVLMTASSAYGTPEELARLDARLIRKPFGPGDLRRLVAEALG